MHPEHEQCSTPSSPRPEVGSRITNHVPDRIAATSVQRAPASQTSTYMTKGDPHTHVQPAATRPDHNVRLARQPRRRPTNERGDQRSDRRAISLWPVATSPHTTLPAPGPHESHSCLPSTYNCNLSRAPTQRTPESDRISDSRQMPDRVRCASGLNARAQPNVWPARTGAVAARSSRQPHTS